MMLLLVRSDFMFGLATVQSMKDNDEGVQTAIKMVVSGGWTTSDCHKLRPYFTDIYFAPKTTFLCY